MNIANKSKVVAETLHYVICPHCDKGRSRICHLFGKTNFSWGTWYCDECGGGYKGVVNGTDVYVDKVERRIDHALVFLRHGDILLVVKGMYFDGDLDLSAKRYFYEEHTCPINYFKDAELIIDLKTKNDDPHGLFEFIGAIPHVEIETLKINIENKDQVKKILEKAK